MCGFLLSVAWLLLAEGAAIGQLSSNNQRLTRWALSLSIYLAALLCQCATWTSETLLECRLEATLSHVEAACATARKA